MNPYQPPDADESQLDRIERKIDRLNGEFALTLMTGAILATACLFALEVMRVNCFKF
jgi:hypothetical protein